MKKSYLSTIKLLRIALGILLFMPFVQGALTGDIKFFIDWSDTTNRDVVNNTVFYGDVTTPFEYEHPMMIGISLQTNRIESNDELAHIAGQSAYTVCFWTNVTSHGIEPGTGSYWLEGDGFGDLFIEFLNESQSFHYAESNQSGLQSELNSTPIGYGELDHWCVARESNGMTTLYRDGVADVSGQMAGIVTTMGQSGIELQYQDGFDDYGGWTRALSAGEVAELYAQGLAGRTYPFTPIDGTTQRLSFIGNAQQCQETDGYNMTIILLLTVTFLGTLLIELVPIPRDAKRFGYLALVGLTVSIALVGIVLSVLMGCA